MNIANRGYFAALSAAVLLLLVAGRIMAGTPPNTQVLKYDAENAAEYQQMWANIYGPLELSAGGSRSVTKFGTTVRAAPFHVGADYSVFDHLN